MFCTSCGIEANEEKFCTQCGFTLPEKSSTPKDVSTPVRITAAIEPVLYYSNVFGGASPIHRIHLENNTGSPIDDIFIRLEVTSLGQKLAHTWERHISKITSQPIDFHDVELIWESGTFLDVIDSQPALASIVVRNAEGLELGKHEVSLDVASANSWYAYGPESFATVGAHVRPNDPRLRQILDSAVAKLGEKGHATVLSGYQQPESHVDEMAEAIYDAVVDLKLTYGNPPASWDIRGQRIRTTEQILEERVGTCLDTAILFAALLENIGLYPVIALVPEHAFVGYISAKIGVDTPGPVGAHIYPIKDVANLVDLGDIKLFETTTVCVSEKPISFTEALLLGKKHITGKHALSADGASHSSLVNICVGRRLSHGRVLSMPIRVVRPDGAVEIIEYRPEEFSINQLIEQLSGGLTSNPSPANTTDMAVPFRLRRWLDDLLDLSLRNPLINFRPSRTNLPLVTVPESLGLIEDLLAKDVTFNVGPLPFSFEGARDDDSDFANDRGQILEHPKLEGHVAEGIFQKQLFSRFGLERTITALRKLANESKTFQEETGTNGLFLALGSLVWVPEGKKEIRSPLILVPVNIISKNRSREFYINLDTTSAVTPNFSLAEKLKRDLGLKLDNLVNLQEDDAGIDVPGTFKFIRERLAEAGLNGFRVDEDAILGFFNFSTYRLWKDLVDNWKTFEKNPLVHHLIYSPNEEFTQPEHIKAETADLDALVAELPIEADSSQALAVSEAVAGKTFILQGPPGTGKSQTITNILAKALHDGKRVLFVAEKKDALDVVKERLDKAGLGDFSLDLHDKGMSIKAVKQQLSDVLDIHIEADKVGFDAALAEYESAIAPLQNYRERLHAPGRLDESVDSALDRFLSITTEKALDIPGEFVANIDVAYKDSVLEGLKSLAQIGPLTGSASQNQWSLTSRLAQPTPEVFAQIKVAAEALKASLAALDAYSVARDYFSEFSSVDEATTTLLLKDTGADGSLVAEGSTPEATALRRRALTSLQELLTDLSGTPYDFSRLADFNITEFTSEYQAVITGGKLLQNMKLNKLLKKLNALIGQEVVTSRQGLDLTLKAMKILSEREQRVREDLSALTALRIDVGTNFFVPADVVKMIASLKRIDDMVNFVTLERSGKITPQQVLAECAAQPQAAVALTTAAQALIDFLKVLETDIFSLDLWQGTASMGGRVRADIDAWVTDASAHNFIQLSQWIDLRACISMLLSSGKESIIRPVLEGSVPFELAPNAFLKGYYETVLELLLVERGFTTFNGLTNADYIRRLNDAHENLRAKLPALIGSRLLERRGFDGSAKTGAVGDLILAIKAQRSRRDSSVRGLLRKHWSVITKITPCVLASPDSTVRFIDPDLTPFDVVVFDEASQIRVANSLGPIGRAKAAVIVGDTMQMPPTSIAQIKGAEDDEETEEDILTGDVESILSQCEIARVPEIMLNWHYRSEDESLIAFSNVQYYKSKLKSFPSPSRSREEKGLSFCFIPDGQFVRPGMTGMGKKGTNQAEVTAIINEIAARLKNPETADESIGVVTFNKEQMEAIRNALADSDDALIQDALANGVGGEDIFVKNLETVQGSERDVILFSIAFSKNTKGELPLNFGPMNNTGGERRLNVAITRARKQVKVFCSFQPAELSRRNPTALGVKHLSEFLHIAQDGPESRAGLFSSEEVSIDRHRKGIVEALVAAGLAAQEEFGLSGFKVDIALFDPAKPEQAVLGVLLDGARWNSRGTVNDRDSLPISVLTKKMGWAAMDRIWLPAWVRDQEGEVERIKQAFALALEASRNPAPKKPREMKKAAPDRVEALAEKPEEVTSLHNPHTGGIAALPQQGSGKSRGVDPVAQLIDSLPHWHYIAPVSLGSQDSLNYLFDQSIQSQIRSVVDQLTERLGALSPGYVAKLIGECYGYSRVTAVRANGILGIGFPGHQSDDEGFIFPRGVNPSEYLQWLPDPKNSARSASDIALIEIANAMTDICRVSQGFDPEKLIAETAKAFGISRMSSAIKERFAEARTLAISLGKMHQDGDYLKSR